MSIAGCECTHINQIADVVSGDYVCEDCGLVIDKFFLPSDRVEDEGKYLKHLSESDEFLAEMLEKLHLSGYVVGHVKKELNKKLGCRHKYSNLLTAQCLYRVLSKLDIPISSRNICAVSGFSSKKILAEAVKRKNRAGIYSESNSESDIICISIDNVVERLCGQLGISFRDCSLIKKSINIRYSGFNPNTVASSYIYMHCKKHLKKIKLKDICVVSGISCMSVHRFLKRNALSFRT